MPGFAEFEQVARLDQARVRRLLAEGDGQERVWAGWAVAMRDRARALEILREAFACDPDPGVRRHHLVVLASLGEHDLVARAAARDCQVEVRATATRYLARLAEPDHAGAYDLVVARTLDLAWSVRYEVADALRIDAPIEVVRVVAGLLFDPDPDVRAALRRRLERGDFPSGPFANALAVVRRAEAHRDEHLGEVSPETSLMLYRPLRPV